jgi:hypothetical protein
MFSSFRCRCSALCQWTTTILKLVKKKETVFIWVCYVHLKSMEPKINDKSDTTLCLNTSCAWEDHRNLIIIEQTLRLSPNGAHTKRLLYKTSPLQNVSIQNVYTHNVSLTKRLLNETSPVTKRLRNTTSPRLFFL